MKNWDTQLLNESSKISQMIPQINLLSAGIYLTAQFMFSPVSHMPCGRRLLTTFPISIFLTSKHSSVIGCTMWPAMGHFPGFLASRMQSMSNNKLLGGVQKSSLRGLTQLGGILFGSLPSHSFFFLQHRCDSKTSSWHLVILRMDAMC